MSPPKINRNYSSKYIAKKPIFCRIFTNLSHEDIPQVRKVTAIVINEMIKLIPKTSDSELLNIFSKFFKDEQDSVRMQGIDTCVAFAKHLS